MEAEAWKIISIVLLVICVMLAILLYLYRRQVDSICRQLRVHRKEHSNTDIWLDYYRGPFGKLQKELNGILKVHREERARYQRTEQTRKELITNISHDIRTPITSVSGYFQLLNQTEDPVKRDEYVQIITGRLNAFQGMLEDFFAYTSASSDDKKIDLEKLNITKVVSESLFIYFSDIEAKLGTPTIDFPEEDLFAYADESVIKRMIQNMVKNALTHGDGDFKVSLTEDDNSVTIDLSNHTSENLPENPEAVFERTYRADKARSIGGTGLGLSIVKEFADKIGGNVSAYTLNDDTFGIKLSLKKSMIKKDI